MATTVFYPDANPESTSVDGRVGRANGINETFGVIRAGAGLFAEDSATVTDLVLLTSTTTSNQYSGLIRSIILFDTSSIPDSDVISAAILEIYVVLKDNTLGNLSFVVVASTPASNTALVAADYAQTGTTALSNTLAVNSVSTSAYNTWTLNATGLAAISKTSITKLALVLENDRSNSAPSWVSGVTTKINGHFADAANKPKLTVTHAPVIGGIPIFYQ